MLIEGVRETGLEVVVGKTPRFLRSEVGEMVVVALLLEMVRGAPVLIAEGWPFDAGPMTLSRSALMSGGMGVRWTMLTACQSAGWTNETSFCWGGLQQPGHPGLWTPVFEGGGSDWAHWDRVGHDNTRVKNDARTYLAISAAVEGLH